MKRGHHPSRREFFGSSLLLAGVPPLCCRTPEAPAGSFSWQGQTLVLDLERIPELRPAKTACAVVDLPRKLNLIVVHADRKRFVAMSRACTHGGAMCAYHRERGTVQCTSLNHAEYDLNGTLLHGRTHGNLCTYRVQAVGKQLRIEIGTKA